ncbi:MAG TPA: amidohydrolase [Flavobacterium sp.]|nr:amidohydrolase [Flavobacterium sp.]
MIISVIQAPLVWQNPIANLLYFQKTIRGIKAKPNLIVLPEMFTSGFTMHPVAVAESMQGESVSWIKALAKEKNTAIIGSIAIFENKKFYNRLLFVYPSGEIFHYDKRHLFTLAGENIAYDSGNEKLIVEYNGWKICPLICYDLRFPVFSRNYEDYDLLVYIANWPDVRINAWNILLKARSVENMCYTVGVNRIGEDNNGHFYPGHSQIVDEIGNYVLPPKELDEGVFTVFLDKNKMFETRNKLSFLKDRDLGLK